MRLRVLYHGNCFDGCSSAGVFTRFYKERVAKAPVQVSYRPLEHKGSPQDRYFSHSAHRLVLIPIVIL